MVRTISATAAHTTLGDLLDGVVATGEPVIIEKHGVPVAVLVSADEYAHLQRQILEHGLADYQAHHTPQALGEPFPAPPEKHRP